MANIHDGGGETGSVEKFVVMYWNDDEQPRGILNGTEPLTAVRM